MLEELLGIFGGTGAVLLGIGTCVWGVLKRYSFDFVRGMPISNVPIETLQNSWEIPFDEECEKPCNRMVFATKNDKDQWKINMKNHRSLSLRSRKDAVHRHCAVVVVAAIVVCQTHRVPIYKYRVFHFFTSPP